jgi:Transposase IS200 like
MSIERPLERLLTGKFRIGRERRELADHVHMCISIPPKYAVSNVVGYMKGKSAITIARKFGGRQRNFTGEVWPEKAPGPGIGRCTATGIS